ncbi:TonB-dependent receptor [Maribacter sp. CXY002]|uniref:TonB-dependent receptor n=1 Tax=Maribacter luteocoastalis TaxID=3407671 RepID=UPI003B682B76
MGKTSSSTLISYFFLAFLLFITNNGIAQVTPNAKIGIIGLFQQLEEKYNVKFSYVDEDLKDIQVSLSELGDLNKILYNIQQQTVLKIDQLNERYYAITKSKTINICAKVLDNFEKNTIPGATIQVLDNEKTAITNADGSFYLENISPESTIQISHLGFKPLFIKAEKLAKTEPCTLIVMALSYQELEEVIVYKFLTDGLAKLTDASIQLNTAKFGILPGLIEPDILQTVQALPGIKSVDETVSEINIRGGTNDQNLILWDGIKMYQSGHFFGLISAFNPYLTDEITVIKNGSSALYGDGVSGVLNMRTRNSIENHVFGGAGVNFISGDVFGQIPISESLAIQFSGRRSHTDFLNSPTYTTFSEKAFQDTQVNSESDFYFYDFTSKVLYDINPYQKIRVSMISMANNLEYLESNPNYSIPNKSNLEQYNFSIGGALESEWTDFFNTDLNAYYTQYRLDALSLSNNAAQELKQNNLVKESAIKFNTAYQLNEQSLWKNGYQFVETGVENRTNLNQPLFKSEIKGVIRTHAVYSEFEYQSPNEKLWTRTGGRLNYIENVNTFKEFIFEPRINISYELVSNFKTEVLGEFKSQTTNQIIDLEQNFLGIERRRWILSDNTNLPITKSKQGSLGFNYDENSFYVGVEGFYKKVEGINIRTQGFQNQSQFESEVGEYTVKGLEFLINQKNNYYSAWLSYTYNVNDYNFEGIDPTNFPNNIDIRHAFTLAGNYNHNNFKLGIGFNYRSGKPYTQPDAINPIDATVVPNKINYQEPNSDRLPEYFRADASANYDFNISNTIKASIGASVLNFTNRKNTLNTYYRLNDANEIETIQRISLGVTPNASFRVSF